MSKSLNEALLLIDAMSDAEGMEAISDDTISKEAFDHFRIRPTEAVTRLQNHFSKMISTVRRERLNLARESRLSTKNKIGSTLKLAREKMIEQLSKLQVQYPELQVAHRDYSVMTDTDLASLLEDLERLTNSHGH